VLALRCGGGEDKVDSPPAARTRYASTLRFALAKKAHVLPKPPVHLSHRERMRELRAERAEAEVQERERQRVAGSSPSEGFKKIVQNGSFRS